METPSSSTRRVTRSQAKAAASANVIPTNNIPISKMRLEECENKKGEKCRQRNGRNNQQQQQQQERCALIDITNDSPIIGLAMGNVTPSSSMAMGKKRAMMTSTATATPGSGEALLRGQVKNLLQKVEEEKSHLYQLPLGDNNNNNRHFLAHLQSPMNLLAPTPANTPHLNPSQNLLPSVTPTPVEDKFTISQIIVNGKEECAAEEELKVTRSLLLEFSEKLEGSDSSSMVTNETVITASAGGGGEDDVSSSLWSIQANAASGSTIDDDNEEEEEWVEEEEEDDDDGEEEEGEKTCNGGDLEELCQGMKKMGFNGEGKHTRFVYNSDGEIEGAVAVVEEEEGCCGGALVLKGLPPPRGKHLRFHEEE